MGYTELKSYTHYSFLRGASSPKEMIEAAIELGLRGLAITDLGGVYGVPKAYHALQELRREPPPRFPLKNLEAFQLIVGAELPLKEGIHGESLVLIAPDREAYGAMCRIISLSHEKEAKGVGGLFSSEFAEALKTIPAASKIFLFPEWEDAWFQEKSFDRITTRFQFLLELRNPIYIPLARHSDGFDRERTVFAQKLAEHFEKPLVAHQGALFARARDQELQDVVSSIREGSPLAELGLKLKRNGCRRLKSPEEMESLFVDLPECILNTERVRQSCHFSLSELKYQYPSEWIPEGFTPQAYLVKLCEEGVKLRYPEGASPAVLTQLGYELRLIDELKFADYFLTVYDIVAFARSKKILCQGRGSAANSIVCYLLGITAMDPIRMNFLFERFISVERGEPPDIDVDFEHERREEVIQYIYQKYGRDRSAMVSAVVTYRRRSALREVAKAFSLPVGTLSARAVEKEFFQEIGAKLSVKKKQKILEMIDRIEGFPRHLSIHSGGFTLSGERLDTLVPIEPATMEGRTIVQWDKTDLDILGLLKIDVLSLGMLSLIRKNLDLIGMEFYEVPSEDPKTYEMITRADTIGVFQIESRAQMSMLPRLKPKCFYDLVVEVALVRPGPIVGKMVHPYLLRRQGKEKVEIPHPALIPILGRTYGVPIFQEQVMKMAVALGGFTPGEADRLRRAIGAWRSRGSIDEMGMKLKNGLMKAGLPESFSNRIFEQIKGFSEYGFPESHAASFALITYVSCYLKCHYPAEFLCSILNSQPMGFYSPHTLLDDAKRHGVKVLPIEVNTSMLDCAMEEGAVRLGFRYLRNANLAELEKIERERKKNGKFLSFQSFFSRVQISFRNLRALAMADAFFEFGLSRREALFQILALQPELFQQEEIQGALFPESLMPRLSAESQVVQDYRSQGLSTRGHPMLFLREKLLGNSKWKSNAQMNSKKVKEKAHGAFVVIPGLSVILQRPPTAKGTAFATLEDEEGVLDLIFHREVFERNQDTIRDEAFLWVSGVLQKESGATHVVVKSLRPIFSEIEIPVAPGAIAKQMR